MLHDMQGIRFLNNYVLMVTLGRGSFGKVMLALNTYDLELYALKLLPKHPKSRSTGSTGVEDIQQEIDVMTSLSHPNVVSLKEVIGEQFFLFGARNAESNFAMTNAISPAL